MSLSKEQLLAVNGLHLSGMVNDIDNIQLGEYCEKLFTFTEIFPSHETELKNFLSSKNYNAFSKSLLGVQHLLKSIEAIGLAQSCQRLEEELSTQKYTVVEAHLNYLLAEISALSIDIQMAQHKRDEPDKTAAKIEPAVPDEKSDDEVVQKNILAVDDVSFLLVSLKSILLNSKYKFTGVTSGEAALRYVNKFSPDLFILDIEMPDMNGYELTKKLRQRGQTAPVIFLTGNATRDYVQKAIEVGAADFIVKPVNKEQVLEKIMNQIG